jgi:thiol-disulfide isomerase/thioredoxin
MQPADQESQESAMRSVFVQSGRGADRPWSIRRVAQACSVRKRAPAAIAAALATAVGAAAPTAASLGVTLAAAASGVGCSSAGQREPAIPAGASTTVLSLAHADCASCGERLATAMRAVPHVYRSFFDRKRAELTVTADPTFDVVGEARRLSKGEPYEIVPGAGHGSYMPWQEPPAGVDVRIVVRDGRDVPDLSAFLAPNKVTVFDFSATWCEPCRRLDEHMLAVVAQRSDVAYRKLDIDDWDSPLAKHYLRDVSQIPYVLVYDKHQRKSATMSGLDLARLDGAISAAAATEAAVSAAGAP